MAARLTDADRALRAITETEWTKDVLQVAALGGWTGYHTYRSKKSPKGFPDWVFWRTGETIFVELKRETTDPTPEQAKVIAGLLDGGSRVYVWRPRDLEHEVTDVLLARRGRTI